MALRLKPIKELIMEWCEIISEGKSGLVLEQEISVWLSCYGIPLNLWNSTNVKRIGGLWGHFLYCERDMNQPKSFACAKIKISTKCMEPINKVVNLVCQGVSYPVRVCEEQVVIKKLMNAVCKCQKNQEMEELGSSNALQNRDMARTNKDKKGDADMEDDSDHVLDI
ncbi:hypothetical protein CsSME_00002983 [Camellia sinensis var. sinensis]